MNAGTRLSLARREEGGRCACGRDPLRDETPNLRGEVGKHDTASRVGVYVCVGRGEGKHSS